MAEVITRDDVEVLEHTVADELTAMSEAWDWFENLVGLKGRKMFARIDETAGTGGTGARCWRVSLPSCTGGSGPPWRSSKRWGPGTPPGRSSSSTAGTP
ncbi:hypothetical protein FXN61_26300 [Lentzea sp. PSKA42]|uniref:Uncharacterized protein n=1 Tax=Lentzea indica TaxID=2604800 RepID=A0ABX1FMI8_9PSEU|nr:hypothetical protein [Lentzea indica]NKE60120.1 hypothetical protein [Lentzea indica]